MYYKLIAPNKLKVILTAKEAVDAQIDWESYNPLHQKKIRRYLVGIFTHVSPELSESLTTGNEKLVIEIYPQEDGSATIFFLVTSQTQPMFAPIIFSFKHYEALIIGAVFLFKVHSHRILKSSLYFFQDRWHLALKLIDGEESPAVTLLREYSAKVTTTETAFSVLTEHGKPIIRERAVDMLNYYFK